ncbi:hypothetical protein ASZ90_017856 [hydrocarbon metagenome]|uniref:Uncharacterized protein n=1 Tax=hydrocarbon metagenome TaxID=938273 RepID=A0A0W8E8F5_9ZZZZ
MRSRKSERIIKKEQDTSRVERLRLKYNLLGILVLVLMGILAFDLGGIGTRIARFLVG